MAAALLDLEFEFVRRQERDLHPREKCGEKQREQYDYNGRENHIIERPQIAKVKQASGRQRPVHR